MGQGGIQRSVSGDVRALLPFQYHIGEVTLGDVARIYLAKLAYPRVSIDHLPVALQMKLSLVIHDGLASTFSSPSLQQKSVQRFGSSFGRQCKQHLRPINVE